MGQWQKIFLPRVFASTRKRLGRRTKTASRSFLKSFTPFVVFIRSYSSGYTSGTGGPPAPLCNHFPLGNQHPRKHQDKTRIAGGGKHNSELLENHHDKKTTPRSKGRQQKTPGKKRRCGPGQSRGRVFPPDKNKGKQRKASQNQQPRPKVGPKARRGMLF